MKTVRKSLILAACAIMLVCATIAGTLAYLTATDSVKNTFTVGNVAITMDETDVDDSTPNEDRDTENKYKLLPGQTYTKDPIIHVGATSEDCYVFVKVENGLSVIEGGTTIAQQMNTNGWTVIDEENGIYGKTDPVSANANVVVFENFTINSTADAETLEEYADAEIKVTAYAIQADGFESAQEAWTNAGAEAQG